MKVTSVTFHFVNEQALSEILIFKSVGTNFKKVWLLRETNNGHLITCSVNQGIFGKNKIASDYSHNFNWWHVSDVSYSTVTFQYLDVNNI